jgi:23S rRNA pseudouridine1911/1915/1917 synthase
MKPDRLSILHADGHVIAADKPAGMHTAPLEKKGEKNTLLDLVMERFPEVSGLPGIKSVEPGLLHRLDRETSGIVLVARTAESFERLRDDFAGGLVQKEYVAIASIGAEVSAFAEGGLLMLKSRFAPYGPGRKKVRVVPLQQTGTGAPRGTCDAVYETEARIEAVSRGLALVRVHIRKGFRHQVRAHLSFLGLPIIGDPLYGAPVPEGAPERMYLHAISLELRHPATGEPLALASPMPAEFIAVMHRDPT